MTVDGQLFGDPLEVEMFKTTNWQLVEQDDDDIQLNTVVMRHHEHSFELRQICQFNFVAELQRMSVVVSNNYTDSVYMFTKGSPETIHSVC